MVAGSIAVIRKCYSQYVVMSLLFVILVMQGIGFGFLDNMDFLLRNLSIIGGLIVIFNDSTANRSNATIGMTSETFSRKLHV